MNRQVQRAAIGYVLSFDSLEFYGITRPTNDLIRLRTQAIDETMIRLADQIHEAIEFPACIAARLHIDGTIVLCLIIVWYRFIVQVAVSVDRLTPQNFMLVSPWNGNECSRS